MPGHNAPPTNIQTLPIDEGQITKTKITKRKIMDPTSDTAATAVPAKKVKVCTPSSAAQKKSSPVVNRTTNKTQKGLTTIPLFDIIENEAGEKIMVPTTATTTITNTTAAIPKKQRKVRNSPPPPPPETMSCSVIAAENTSTSDDISTIAAPQKNTSTKSNKTKTKKSTVPDAQITSAVPVYTGCENDPRVVQIKNRLDQLRDVPDFPKALVQWIQFLRHGPLTNKPPPPECDDVIATTSSSAPATGGEKTSPRKVAEVWKSMSDEEKAPYRLMFAEEKARRRLEIENATPEQKEKVKLQKELHRIQREHYENFLHITLGYPGRCMTARKMFENQFQAPMNEKGKPMRGTNLSKLIKSQWMDLSKSDREHWERQRDKEKLTVLKMKEQWCASHPEYCHNKGGLKSYEEFMGTASP